MQIVWSEEIKEALERVCAYAHEYRVDVVITFGADGDAELKVEPSYWDKDKDTADTLQTEKDKVVCPNCGRSDYIRSFEKDFGIKNSEYRYKCINCNTYIS